MKRRVVVTGLGCVTPVGNDVPTTWEALLAGKSGGAPITQFDTTGFKVNFACEVKGFDPLTYMDRKEVKRSDRYTQLAVAAATQAMKDAFPDGTGFTPERTGVVIGSGIGGIYTFEDQLNVYRTLGPSKISRPPCRLRRTVESVPTPKCTRFTCAGACNGTPGRRAR